MRNDQIKLRLTIDVTYDLGRTDVKDLKQVLVRASEHLYTEGLLSGDTEASVEQWGSTVMELYDDPYEKDAIRCGEKPFCRLDSSGEVNRIL